MKTDNIKLESLPGFRSKLEYGQQTSGQVQFMTGTRCEIGQRALELSSFEVPEVDIDI